MVLGATGMAGHTIAIYLKESGHDVTAFSRSKFGYCDNIQGDLTRPEDIQRLANNIINNKYDCVINCLGILNSDAENNKHTAVLINSYIPHYLSFITENTDTKVIHMSTDCVFSGKVGKYSEQSLKDGETFYDRSKALGEIYNTKDLTFRCSIIGPDMNVNGIGLFNWFMKQEKSISGYTRAIWTGVTTITLAKAMEQALIQGISGIYNLVNNTDISKFDLLGIMNNYFKENRIIINKSEDISVDKSLVNNRKDFDFIVPSYDDMIKNMKEWVNSHKELYPHYYI